MFLLNMSYVLTSTDTVQPSGRKNPAHMWLVWDRVPLPSSTVSFLLKKTEEKNESNITVPKSVMLCITKFRYIIKQDMYQ